MLTLEQALEQLISAIPALPATEAEDVPTSAAAGRVLAEDVRSPIDVPPQDNTAMDGYAVCCADVLQPGTVLPISQRIAAGAPPQSLVPGTAARIFTGGQIPSGADAVVMQEHAEPVAEGVRFDVVPTQGQWIRRRGEDVAMNCTVLARGERLTPQALGLAASVGAASMRVVRRPRVALLSTGNELVMPGEALKPGAIYDSNRSTLHGLIEKLGCACIDLGSVPDQLSATREALRHAARSHDVVVSSGGVSVGEEDHLKAALQAEGRLNLWQIAIKPGKPLAFGAIERSDGSVAWFFGLPGNPVSAFVTFLMVLRPILLRLQGVSHWRPRGFPLRADFDWPRADRRQEFLRVRRNDDGGVDLFTNQGSGVLTSVVWADGLVDHPAGQTIRRGDMVRYLPFSELLA